MHKSKHKTFLDSLLRLCNSRRWKFPASDGKLPINIVASCLTLHFPLPLPTPPLSGWPPLTPATPGLHPFAIAGDSDTVVLLVFRRLCRGDWLPHSAMLHKAYVNRSAPMLIVAISCIFTLSDPGNGAATRNLKRQDIGWMKKKAKFTRIRYPAEDRQDQIVVLRSSDLSHLWLAKCRCLLQC